jgi:hypothetical protein
VPKGKRAGLFLDVIYETSEAAFHFEGRHVLGSVEMRILQGLVALAPVWSDDGMKLSVGPETSNQMGLEHRQTLELKGFGVEMDAIVVETTFYELAKEIGYGHNSFHSGYQVRLLRTSLERLWGTTVLVVYREGGRREGYHLISRYQSTADGKFSVAINPRVAQCVVGARRFTKLDMAEIRALKTDPARFIHQRLCGWIDPGKHNRVNVDSLCGYVWHDQALNVNTIRKRKGTVRKALRELESLGWAVDEYAQEKFLITRRGLAN